VTPPGLVDASGEAFAPADPPQRIVSLIPSTTELLCDLGLADRLVGVTAYCVEPKDIVRTKARIGGEKDPDLDRIRALAPDLVIANVEENVRAHVDTLRGWGIRVWVTYPRTVAESLRMIRELGEVTGTGARAEALATTLEAELAAIRAAAGGGAVRVFYAIWRNPYMTVSGDTYISDVLAACGAANVFADAHTRYPAVTLDDVAARRPEVILLPDEPFRFRRAHLKDFEPYRDVPAVREGRIYLVDGKPFSWHGRRLGDALRRVPELLRGAAASPPASYRGRYD
jgi:ABC-type Fe3+-hydroxamate transport system substrate-binding protein